MSLKSFCAKAFNWACGVGTGLGLLAGVASTAMPPVAEASSGTTLLRSEYNVEVPGKNNVGRLFGISTEGAEPWVIRLPRGTTEVRFSGSSGDEILYCEREDRCGTDVDGLSENHHLVNDNKITYRALRTRDGDIVLGESRMRRGHKGLIAAFYEVSREGYVLVPDQTPRRIDVSDVHGDKGGLENLIRSRLSLGGAAPIGPELVGRDAGLTIVLPEHLHGKDLGMVLFAEDASLSTRNGNSVDRGTWSDNSRHWTIPYIDFFGPQRSVDDCSNVADWAYDPQKVRCHYPQTGYPPDINGSDAIGGFLEMILPNGNRVTIPPGIFPSFKFEPQESRGNIVIHHDGATCAHEMQIHWPDTSVDFYAWDGRYHLLSTPLELRSLQVQGEIDPVDCDRISHIGTRPGLRNPVNPSLSSRNLAGGYRVWGAPEPFGFAP